MCLFSPHTTNLQLTTNLLSFRSFTIARFWTIVADRFSDEVDKFCSKELPYCHGHSLMAHIVSGCDEHIRYSWIFVSMTMRTNPSKHPWHHVILSSYFYHNLEIKMTATIQEEGVAVYYLLLSLTMHLFSHVPQLICNPSISTTRRRCSFRAVYRILAPQPAGSTTWTGWGYSSNWEIPRCTSFHTSWKH